MASAIVVGATGIIGRALVARLLEDGSISTVYTISRSSHGLQHPKIQHSFLNLRTSADEMTAELSAIGAEYIYFCAYTAPNDPEQMFRLNNSMLSNFITALEGSGSISRIKRFILTCGLKQYGVHLGQPKQPMAESDPMLADNIGDIDWPANFYYTQQQTLSAAAVRHGFEWICTLPKDVIGYARGNFMNQATALGLYCAVSQALPGSALPFPGNRDNFFSFNTWTSADLHVQFCIWAATEPGVGNNIFNVVNGDVESWQSLWPRLAARFQCVIPDAPFTTHLSGPDSSTFQLKTRQPIAARGALLGISSDALMTQGATIDLPIDLDKWAKRPDVLEAWQKLRDQYGLDHKAWERATWGFMSMAFGRNYSTVATMSKARKFGWKGYYDTWDAFESTFGILEAESILPPSK